MKEIIKPGFLYTVEVIDKNGVVIDREEVHNLMPTEGMNHLLNVVLKGASQSPNWFVGVYENAYTPVAGDTMATFAATSAESTAYAGSTRPAFTSGTVADGAVDNTASKAEFTFNATKTIYGGFISSSSTRGGTAGTLLSAVRFSSPKAMENGSVLRVTAGFTIASL